MKVLKKIKARIGLSNKAALHCPPAQPLEFHPVHGDNVLLTQGNTIAARYNIFTIYPFKPKTAKKKCSIGNTKTIVFGLSVSKLPWLSWLGQAWLLRQITALVSSQQKPPFLLQNPSFLTPFLFDPLSSFHKCCFI